MASIVNIEHHNLTYGGQGAGGSIAGVLGLVKRESMEDYYSYALKLSDCGSASSKTVEVPVNRESLKLVAQQLLAAIEADEQGEGRVL